MKKDERRKKEEKEEENRGNQAFRPIMEWLLGKGLTLKVPVALLSEGEVSKASYKAVGSKIAKI